MTTVSLVVCELTPGHSLAIRNQQQPSKEDLPD
jgi:hypothetical protein